MFYSSSHENHENPVKSFALNSCGVFHNISEQHLAMVLVKCCLNLEGIYICFVSIIDNDNVNVSSETTITLTMTLIGVVW